MRPRQASTGGELDLIAAWRQDRVPPGSDRPDGAGSGMPAWTWPAAAAGSAAAMAVAFAAQLGAPWQPIAALVFLAVGPGASLVPLIGLRDRGMELMLVIPVSLAVGALTSAALFYPGLWSPARELALLLAVCLLGLTGQRIDLRRGTRIGGLR